ncbi:hypothetical protein [Paenibacillus glycinis]|uniref:PH domain-containing protein n=1 Tax=Paenibacillus glycinis TaxID=2697035 RepID=A0ABW9XKI7_9BACL|nr:hypothetical protein [Paenibacillus glycinis]NBD23149.1 hypothetical protein [Paenibacillus glycinis]
METIRHAVKHPSGVTSMIALTAIGALMLMNAIRYWEQPERLMLSFVPAMLAFYCLVAVVWSLYSAFKKPTELHLGQGKLRLNGRTIEAKDIKVILKRGYFRPVLGIKPVGKAIVPVPLCFRFCADEEQGLADLAAWAEKNKVAVVHKSFTRWI